MVLSKQILSFFLFSANLKGIIIIYKTNKFNCSSRGCEESIYNNIGLISTYEYKEVGGIESYLGSKNNYYSIKENRIENITASGIEETNETTTSGIRAVVYLENEVRVTGSGRVDDPYVIVYGSDINIVGVTINGEKTDKSYEELIENNVVNRIICENGSKASWDYSDNSITIEEVKVPDYCTIDFKEGYTVSLNVPNGNITTANPISVGHKGRAKYTISAKSGYKLEGATISCTNGQIGEINTTTGEVNITNITSSTTCTVNLTRARYTVNVTSNNTNYGTVSQSATTVEPGGNVTVTISAKNGYMYKSNTCGVEPINNVITLTNINSNKNCRVDFQQVCLVTWCNGSNMYDQIEESFPYGTKITMKLVHMSDGKSKTPSYISIGQTLNEAIQGGLVLKNPPQTFTCSSSHLYVAVDSSGSDNYLKEISYTTS